MEIKAGPVLTDKELYLTLDTDRYPELKECIKDYENGEEQKARQIFAKTVREIFDVEKFFTIPGKNKKPDFTDGVKEKAERALRHEMRSCGTTLKYEGKVDWFANPTYNQYKEWTWQLSRHDELVGLAVAYRASSDERYAVGCAELLDSWIKQAVRPELTESGYATLCWRSIECGIRMGLMWPEIIHTFIKTEAFDDNLVVDIFKSLYEHAQSILHRFTVANWHIHELDGLGQLGIFYPVFKDSGEWYRTAVTRLYSEMKDQQVHPDGFHYELTPGYHGVVIHHVMAFAEVAEIYGKEVPSELYGVIENMLTVYVKLMQANGCIPNINDGGGGKADAMVRKYMRYFPDNKLFKWLTGNKEEGENNLDTALLFENCGIVTMRDDWDKPSVSLLFDAGLFGRGHQHEDKLNLLIYNTEKQLLCEANTYAYDTSDARRYCLSSRGHNVVLVDGSEQNRRKTYKWEQKNLTEKAFGAEVISGEKADVAKGIYNEMFGESVPGETVHKRNVIFVKKPKYGTPLVIAIDKLESDNNHEYTAIWHFDTKNAALRDGNFVSDEITAFICGDKGECELVCGQRTPVFQGFICRSGLQGAEEPIPTLLHKYKGKNTFTVTVFSVHGEEGSPVKSATLDGSKVKIEYKTGETETVETEC